MHNEETSPLKAPTLSKALIPGVLAILLVCCGAFYINRQIVKAGFERKTERNPNTLPLEGVGKEQQQPAPPPPPSAAPHEDTHTSPSPSSPAPVVVEEDTKNSSSDTANTQPPPPPRPAPKNDEEAIAFASEDLDNALASGRLDTAATFYALDYMAPSQERDEYGKLTGRVITRKEALDEFSKDSFLGFSPVYRRSVITVEGIEKGLAKVKVRRHFYDDDVQYNQDAAAHVRRFRETWRKDGTKWVLVSSEPIQAEEYEGCVAVEPGESPFAKKGLQEIQPKISAHAQFETIYTEFNTLLTRNRDNVRPYLITMMIPTTFTPKTEALHEDEQTTIYFWRVDQITDVNATRLTADVDVNMLVFNTLDDYHNKHNYNRLEKMHDKWMLVHGLEPGGHWHFVSRSVVDYSQGPDYKEPRRL